MTIIDDTRTAEQILTVTEIIAAAEWADLRDLIVSTRAKAKLDAQALVLTGTGKDHFGFIAKGLTVALELFDTCIESDFLDLSFKLRRELEHADYVVAKRAGVLKAQNILRTQALAHA